MKKNAILLGLSLLSITLLTSCGSFGEGLLMGMAQGMSTYGSYNPYSTGTRSTTQSTTNLWSSTPTTYNASYYDWSSVPTTYVADTSSSYSSSSSSYSSLSSSSSSSSSSRRQCGVCKGTGRVTVTQSGVATFGLGGTTHHCEECGKTWNSGVEVHSHTDCRACHGTGYISSN